MRLSVWLWTIFYSTLCFGTTFVPISLKQQVYESEVIVYGTVMEQNTISHPDLGIATVVKIKGDKWIGTSSKENTFNVFYPGGTLDDKSVTVEGVPNFKVAEKVVVFLGKDDQGNLWVKNLGLGKYSQKNIGKSKILVNQVFPNDPKIGQISKTIFFELVQRLKGERFNERLKGKYERFTKTKKGGRQGRSIASESNIETNSSHWLKVTWLLGIFISLFLVSGWIRRRLK